MQEIFFLARLSRRPPFDTYIIAHFLLEVKRFFEIFKVPARGLRWVPLPSTSGNSIHPSSRESNRQVAQETRFFRLKILHTRQSAQKSRFRDLQVCAFCLLTARKKCGIMEGYTNSGRLGRRRPAGNFTQRGLDFYSIFPNNLTAFSSI